MKMLNFSAFRFIIWVTPLDRPQENKQNETFPVSERFMHEENLEIQIWLYCGCASTVQSFTPWKLSFTASAAFIPGASCHSSFYFFLLRVFHLCYSCHESEMQKCDIFFFTSVNIGTENRTPPEMTFDIDFRMTPDQFDFSIPQWIFVPNFILSSNLEQFLCVTPGLIILDPNRSKVSYLVNNRRLRSRWPTRRGLTFMQFLPWPFAALAFVTGNLWS